MSTPVISSDPTDWRLVIDIVQFSLGIVLGIYMWIMAKGRVSEERITKNEESVSKRFSTMSDAVDKRMDGLGERLIKVETSIAYMPTRESTGKTHARLDQVQQLVAENRGELKGIHKTLDLIHKHMLESS